MTNYVQVKNIGRNGAEIYRKPSFDVRRYDLASVGRYKVNKKLDVISRAIGYHLAEDLVNKDTGEVILPAETLINYSTPLGNTVKYLKTTANISA